MACVHLNVVGIINLGFLQCQGWYRILRERKRIIDGIEENNDNCKHHKQYRYLLNKNPISVTFFYALTLGDASIMLARC